MKSATQSINVDGPMALEERLIDLVRAAKDRDPFAQLLLVVPSATLRRSLSRALSRALGGAVLGLRIVNVETLAAEIADAAGLPESRVASEGFDVLARRAAAAEPELAAELSRFDDGFGATVGALSDLISAGLEADLAAAADEDISARTAALLRAALRTMNDVRALGVYRRSDLLARAAAALHAEPSLMPRADETWIVGFADAPGRTVEFLRALIERASAGVILDLPSGFTTAGEAPPQLMARRFASRLGIDATSPVRRPSRTTDVRLVECSTTDIAARELAWRLREALANGDDAEDIVVAVRGLDGFAASIRRRFDEFGIPFSGGRLPSSFSPAGRVADAMSAVLSGGANCTASQFFDALGPAVAPMLRARLELAHRAVAAARLGDVAVFDWEALIGDDSAFRLPVRRGLGARLRATDDGGDDSPADDGTPTDAVDGAGDGEDDRDDVAVGNSQGVARADLIALRNRARATLDLIESWPTRTSAANHASLLTQLVTTALGWIAVAKGDLAAQLIDLIDRCAEDFGGLGDLGIDEFRRLVAARLDEAHAGPLGGNGGGVAVMELSRARGVAARRLFVLGVERGALPAAAAEDALFPDRERMAARRRLPALGLSGDRPTDEMHAFASLLSAAPEVTLFRRTTDADGRVLAASTFWIGLATARGLESQRVSGTLRRILADGVAPGSRRPLAPFELPLAAGLLGGSDDRRRALEIWLPRRPSRATGGDDGASLINPRLDLAARLMRRGGFQPWSGDIGPARDGEIGSEFHVTTLEAVAKCPWRAFLTKVLRIEPSPDVDGLLADIDARLIGNAIHCAADDWSQRANVPSGGVTNVEDDAPIVVPSPSDSQRAELLAKSAMDVLREEGLTLPGLALGLARRARPYFDVLCELAFTPDARFLRTEAAGRIAIDATHREIRFRVDALREMDGKLQMIDYKSGRPREYGYVPGPGRDAKLLRLAARGRFLQAALYATALKGDGVYMHVHPELEDRKRVFEVTDSPLVRRAVEDAATTLIAAIEGGVFPPRMDQPDGEQNGACESCEVRSACAIDDSAWRRDLRELCVARETAENLDERAAVHLALWRLAVAEAPQ